MAGAHIEREARYAATGLSPVERDELIVKLRNKGWTQAKIAARLGMTQPGVLQALRRIAGIPRKPSKRPDDYAAENHLQCTGCSGRRHGAKILNANYCRGRSQYICPGAEH